MPSSLDQLKAAGTVSGCSHTPTPLRLRTQELLELTTHADGCRRLG